MQPVCFPSYPPVSLNTLVRSLNGTHDLKTDAAVYFETDPEKCVKKMLIDLIKVIASGGLYGVYVIGKGVYDICTVDEKMQVKGDSMNNLIHSLKTMTAFDTKVQFYFNNQLYELKHAIQDIYGSEYTNTDELGLFDEHDQLVHTFPNLNIDGLKQRLPLYDCFSAVEQLRDSLSTRLDEQTLDTFHDMLIPRSNGPQFRNPPLVLGNQHNSIVRLVLGAMMAGNLNIDHVGLDLLARAMKQESELMQHEALQSSDEQSEEDEPLVRKEPVRLNNILNHMTFCAGYTQFINLINCDNDDPCADQDLNDAIAEKLMAVGAIFVSNNPRHLQKKGYCRAYYDKKNGNLYLPKAAKRIDLRTLNLLSEMRDKFWEISTVHHGYLTEYGVAPQGARTITIQHILYGQLIEKPEDFNPTQLEIECFVNELGITLMYSHGSQFSRWAWINNLNFPKPSLTYFGGDNTESAMVIQNRFDQERRLRERRLRERSLKLRAD